MLETFEVGVFRQMVHVHRALGEEWILFYRRRRRAAERLRQVVEAPSLWTRAACAAHASHGEVAHRTGSVAATVSGWRDLLWWSIVQCVGEAEGRRAAP